MSYRVYRLEGWRDAEELTMVRSISITRNISDSTPLIESASMEVDGDWFRDGWYRIYREGAGRSALGSFYFQAKSSKVAHGITTWSCDGYSALYEASVQNAPAGGCARIGADAVKAVAMLLSCCGGSVISECEATMPRNVVYDGTKSRLVAAWQVLDACGLCIQLDGMGNAHVMEVPIEPKFRITTAEHHGVMLDSIGFGDSVTFERDGSDMEMLPFDMVSIAGIEGNVLSQSIKLGAMVSESDEIGVLSRG